MPKNTNKWEKDKINISKHIKKSEELVKMLNELKEKKKLFFHIYDGLKWFDLIMTVIWKEKIIEYFRWYIKDSAKDSKNYSSFVSFIWENKWKEFFEWMRKVYNDILENYDKIKFSNDSFHFGSEEIYLRETLEKIKSVLDNLWELEWKWNFININLSFLNLKNSSLDFNFTDSELEKVDFYTSLEDFLEEDTLDENKLPFFHLLNTLMWDLKVVQERVVDMSNEFKEEIWKDIETLYSQEKDKEIEFIKKSKKQIWGYLDGENLDIFSDMSIEIKSILDNLERNKELVQSIIRKDIETLEESLGNLSKII